MAKDPSYLVWRIAYADIEIRQIRLDHIPQQDLQPLRFRLALHALRDFGRHAWVEFDGDDLFGFFENLDR